MLGGSVRENKGIQPLLDAVVDHYFPLPIDADVITENDPRDPKNKIEVGPLEKEKFVALVLKI